MSAASHPHRKRRVDVNGHLRSTRRRCLHLQCPQSHCPIRPFSLRFAFAALHRGRLPPPPPKAKSAELVMGSFISRLWPRDDSLQEYKRWVEASLDGGDLTVVTKEEAEEARVVSRKVGDARKAALEAASHPFYKEEHVRTTRNDPKLARIALETRLLEDTYAQQRKLRKPEVPAKRPEDLSELFVPLTDEEQEEVKGHLYGRGQSSKILVTHDSSNIEISKEKLQCLRRGGWLNDEVINLYLELLKEREEREPKRFLKCHFFNTFFYKKLASGKAGYDYKSVRRWTTLKKLGYGLIECDKIFIPVHKDIHWCLAIINMKEKTFQYLDSLGGMDRAVLRVLRYTTRSIPKILMALVRAWRAAATALMSLPDKLDSELVTCQLARIDEAGGAQHGCSWEMGKSKKLSKIMERKSLIIGKGETSMLRSNHFLELRVELHGYEVHGLTSNSTITKFPILDPYLLLGDEELVSWFNLELQPKQTLQTIPESPFNSTRSFSARCSSHHRSYVLTPCCVPPKIFSGRPSSLECCGIPPLCTSRHRWDQGDLVASCWHRVKW